MVNDVMVNPDNEEAMVAAETVTVTKYYYFHDEDRKAAARAALRHYMDREAVRKEDGVANCALERIWNVLVGN